MKCPYCGSALSDDAETCGACGKAINVRLKQGRDYVGPLGTSRPLLTWGILAAVFGCIPFTCVLGVIFGLIGLKKANGHARFTGSLYGPARAGKILSIVGIALGAAVSVCAALWILQRLLHWQIYPWP